MFLTILYCINRTIWSLIHVKEVYLDIMKEIIISLLLILFCSISGFSQSYEAIFRDLGQNNLTSLDAQMSGDIELCIEDNQDFFSKKEAISKITKYIEEKGVKSCKMLHSGKTADKGSQYWVGKMTGSTGDYRVFLYIENEKVIEVRLDKFKE